MLLEARLGPGHFSENVFDLVYCLFPLCHLFFSSPVLLDCGALDSYGVLTWYGNLLNPRVCSSVFL